MKSRSMKFERARHAEIYLLGLKIRYKPKFVLPLDMVSKHVLLYFQLPADQFSIFIYLSSEKIYAKYVGGILLCI